MNRSPILSVAIGPVPQTEPTLRSRMGLRSRMRLVPLLLVCLPLLAAPVADITQLSLEQLLDVSIIGASKYEQKQSEVAAAVSVITRSEIKAFGWRTLDAALSSLPGIYTTYDRSYVYMGTRGFGLPGDYNTRLLLTINMDVVQNKIVFEANLGAARKARLKFSSKLLNLASEVWQ